MDAGSSATKPIESFRPLPGDRSASVAVTQHQISRHRSSFLPDHGKGSPLSPHGPRYPPFLRDGLCVPRHRIAS